MAVKTSNKTPAQLQIGAWALSIAVSIVAFIAWGSDLKWQLDKLTPYKLFPLFGLLAFSVMWSHYMAGVLRRYLGFGKEVLKDYFELTSVFVLLCILLHPGLLIWQLWRDGFGLPPTSYLDNYVSKKASRAALLGSLSLLIFLSYELHRWFQDKSWWKYIERISDIGMVLIFIHALRLGRQLQPGWFRVVWWIYGISLLGALVYIYTSRNKVKEEV